MVPSVFAYCQTDERGFFLGVNLGGYFANKNTAYFYNGNTTYGVDRILRTQVYEDQIQQEFQYSYEFGEYPQLMKYQTSFLVGGHLGYRTSETFNLFADIDVINLKLEDVVTFEIDDPSNNQNGVIGPTIEQAILRGEEKRFNVNLGFQSIFHNQGQLKAYFSMAANFTYTQFANNTLTIRQLSPYYIGNPTWNISGGVKPQGGGIGAVAGLGFKYRFNDQVLFDVGYNAYYANIKLNHESQLEPFQARGLQHCPYVRIIWG